MDLRALDYFVAIYEAGSLSAASKAKFIAQPSISASLKQLEQSLNTELFIRHARGVTASTAGEQLYPLAKQLLGQAGAISQLFTENKSKQPFRLGLIKGLGVDRISRLLRQFTTSVDALELTLVAPEDSCEARIIGKEMLEKDERFVAMWKERYQLAIPRSHSLGLQDKVSINDLHQLAFIQRSPCEGWQHLSQKLQNQDIKPDIRARIRTIEYALGLIKAGLGCAFVPVSDEDVEDLDIIFRPLSDLAIEREIGLAYKHQSRIIEVLTHIVVDA